MAASSQPGNILRPLRSASFRRRPSSLASVNRKRHLVVGITIARFRRSLQTVAASNTGNDPLNLVRRPLLRELHPLLFGLNLTRRG